MTNLEGQTVLVTGGSRGFGRGIVEVLVAQGAKLVAIARNESTLAQLKADLNGNVETISADVTDEVRAAQIMRRIRPNVLVLNAGTQAPYRHTRQHTWETFSHIWNVDMKGTFLWAREALLQPLAEGSHIIIVSSGAARYPSELTGGYSAAKAAQWAFTQSLAQEAKLIGIHVHCLIPTLLTPDTELGRDAIETFAQHWNVSTEKILEDYDLNPPLKSETVGAAVLDIISHSKYDNIVELSVNRDGIQA